MIFVPCNVRARIPKLCSFVHTCSAQLAHTQCIDLSDIRASTQCICCIAGNFRERKLLQISWFCSYLRKFSLRNQGAWHLLAATPASNLWKFSLWKSYFRWKCSPSNAFLLYSIACTHTVHTSPVFSGGSKHSIPSTQVHVCTPRMLFRYKTQTCYRCWSTITVQWV